MKQTTQLQPKTLLLKYLGLYVILVLGGCASNTPKTHHIPSESVDAIHSENITTTDAPFPDNTQTEEKEPSIFLTNLRPEDLDIIKAEAKRTTLKNWKNIDERALKTRLRVLQTLNDMGAPEELLFVPVAESGYNPYALSPTGALGLWQLMPRTAIELGAMHRHGLDGRRHVEQSTKAAATYLLKLYDRFSSWPLAICAYNLGPWGVQRRLNKHPWTPEMGLNALPFPAETKHYVKQILGMIALVEKGDIRFSEPLQTLAYTVSPPIDLTQLEKVAGLEKNELFRLNPELDYQHYLKQSISLHLPPENIENIELALLQDPNVFKPKFITVKIKSGDSLWKIAHRHHTNIAYLRKLNPKVKNTLSIGKPIIVPASKSFATTSHKTNPLLANGRRIRYKVRSGDSLWTIAKKFGTSTKSIARINQISTRKLLRPGDRLWIVARFRPS